MFTRFCIGVVGSTLLVGSMGRAQDRPQGGPPDFAQMRQMMMDRLKEATGASDDEWKVIEPRIEKLEDLQRQAGGRGPGMFGPPPGPGGPGGPGNAGGPPAAPDNAGGPGAGGPPPGGPDRGFGGPGGPQGQPQSEVQQKQSDLRETLQNNDATADDVKAKVAALRDARAKAKAELAQAQDDLRQILSLRQEAALVSFGILE
jgi:hypothetical protein